VLVAGGVLREDGVGGEAARAHVVDERLLRLDGERVGGVGEAAQLQVHHRQLVLVAQQAVHEERVAGREPEVGGHVAHVHAHVRAGLAARVRVTVADSRQGRTCEPKNTSVFFRVRVFDVWSIWVWVLCKFRERFSFFISARSHDTIFLLPEFFRTSSKMKKATWRFNF